MKPSDYFKKTTDKIMYHVFYDMAIPLLTGFNGNIRVLEIGCTALLNKFGRGSSNAFSEMPFVEKYVGIDINPPKYDFGDKSTFLHGDAYDPEMVDKVSLISDDYHLIIDDGPHPWQKQAEFFNIYERVSAPTSFMVCEDVKIMDLHKFFAYLDSDKLSVFMSRAKNPTEFDSVKILLMIFKMHSKVYETY